MTEEDLTSNDACYFSVFSIVTECSVYTACDSLVLVLYAIFRQIHDPPQHSHDTAGHVLQAAAGLYEDV